MSELWQESAVALAKGIEDKQFSAEEVLDSVLARIDALNPHLNAIVYDYRDSARADARRADAAVARGDVLGALHGVPVTIKENVDMAGEPTPNGVPALASLIATDDSPVVRNLRAAGAVIVGRTNTPEFSLRATTDNPLHGRTRNPWDDDASPGGSSGGAGSAAAAGFGPVHHGNDIGGSLRFPSFACGVSTVKPTFGRVPAFNPSAGAERGLLAQLMSVQGAIARHVEDLRLATSVMARGDAHDPWWVPAPLYDWPREQDVKIAVTKESHGYPIHPDVLAAIDTTAEQLREAGYVVEEVEVPPVHKPATGWLDVAVYEIRETLDAVAREYGSETIHKIFDWYYEMGDLVDAHGYREGVADRTALAREWNLFLDRYPLVLTPFLMRPLFDWNEDARSAAHTKDIFQAAIYSFGINYLGLPAGVFPTGMVAGRPAGVQLVGRRFREDLILEAMECLQRYNGVFAHSLWEREHS
ncbi:MAG: amidase [Pseudomonadales bacterium]|nr:amidase [Pseudomonadales bacterium]MDP6472858.1 amidase [Pseudomonadales bacterium]MDP6826386.1 amidase [Pseudomonadales bacterium]MDP6972522.1 amidase [Pseudomonadales bacterium]